MARLPQIGGDQGTWGAILNEFLQVAHNEDGTLKNDVINVKDFGAKGDGITDDTAAIQAAINSLPNTRGVPAVAITFPSGTYRITSSLLVDKRSAIFKGFGVGNPSNFTATPGAGSTIRWDGPAGQPMFRVTDSKWLTWEDLFLQGNTSARPSDGIYFEGIEGAGIGTNEQIKISRVLIGSLPWTNPATPTGTPSMDYGIRFGGHNSNNDQFTLQDVVLSHCNVAGLALPNSQSIWGECRNVYFDHCRIGLKTSATHSMYNSAFNFCETDIETASTAQLTVFGWYSEKSSRIFSLLDSSSLSVFGGLWTIQSTMNTSHIGYAPKLGNNFLMQGVKVIYQISPKPPLVLTCTYAQPYLITILGCLGLTMNELKITGYGAPNITYVNIQTQDISLQQMLTGALSPLLKRGPLVLSGTGSPAGKVAAPVGSLYTRTDGTANNTLYIKESGTGTTGWKAK